MGRYRAALVGLGNIAWRYDINASRNHDFLTHAFTYRQDDRVELVGGCSPVAQEREDFSGEFDLPTFASIAALLEKCRPDIVSICSPTARHYEHTSFCLENGVSMIWLEKPPAVTVTELNRLRELRKERAPQAKVAVNYLRRFTERYQKLRQLYQSHSLGACRLIQLNYSRGLMVNGSHILDMLFFVVGDGMEWRLDWISPGSTPDHPSFGLTLAKGLQVIVSGMVLPYHCIDIALTFDEGRAAIIHGGMTVMMERRAGHELFPGYYRLRPSDTALLDGLGVEKAMAAALDNLIEAYEKDSEPSSNLETAWQTQALLEAVYTRQGAPL